MADFTETFASKVTAAGKFGTGPAGIVVTVSKFATSINDTGGKFATGPAGVIDTGSKFATGINNTNGKFATGVNDTVDK